MVFYAKLNFFVRNHFIKFQKNVALILFIYETNFKKIDFMNQKIYEKFLITSLIAFIFSYLQNYFFNPIKQL